IKEYERKEEKNIAEITIPADPNVKNFTYTLVDGELYFRENSIMIKQNIKGKRLERIKGLHHIREITREIINIQMNGCTESELKKKQEILNKRYDEFVK